MYGCRYASKYKPTFLDTVCIIQFATVSCKCHPLYVHRRPEFLTTICKPPRGGRAHLRVGYIWNLVQSRVRKNNVRRAERESELCVHSNISTPATAARPSHSESVSFGTMGYPYEPALLVSTRSVILLCFALDARAIFACIKILVFP